MRNVFIYDGFILFNFELYYIILAGVRRRRKRKMEQKIKSLRRIIGHVMAKRTLVITITVTSIQNNQKKTSVSNLKHPSNPYLKPPAVLPFHPSNLCPSLLISLSLHLSPHPPPSLPRREDQIKIRNRPPTPKPTPIHHIVHR